MLTVLLATRDRARILRNVLEAYCLLEQPSGGWKLVVADNGSTDETPKIIASFADRLPLHSVLETSPGKNSALNSGLALVEGDLIVFTDDDVFPNPEWLVQLRRAADSESDYSIFGGGIVPRWEVPPPPWVNWIEAGPVFAISDPSLDDAPLDPRLVFGPNMAIRASALQPGMRLDPSIGPRGLSYAMGSETELVMRLAAQGHKAWHVRDAVVEHFIRKEQLRVDWVMQRAIRFGRGQYRLNPSSKLWGDLPRHLLRDLPKEGLRIAAAWIVGKPEKLFRSRWRFNYLLGTAIQARIIARSRHSKKRFAPEHGRRHS